MLQRLQNINIEDSKANLTIDDWMFTSLPLSYHKIEEIVGSENKNLLSISPLHIFLYINQNQFKLKKYE